MKSKVLKTSLFAGLAVAISALVTALPSKSARPGLAGTLDHFMGVRVQWLDLSGNHAHTICTVHLVNRSLTEPITIEEFVVVGPGGRNDLIGVATGTIGTTLSPLQELRVPINSSTVPGASPQTAEGTHGVRNAIVKWSGPADGLHMESIQIRHPHHDATERIYWVTPSYRVVD